jgi:hypothetical protein
MKRPKFFEDLDRSLAGEAEVEPTVEPKTAAQEDAEIRVRALQNLWQGHSALLAMHARCSQVEMETRRIEQGARMQQCVGMDQRRMERQAMIAINTGQFHAASVRSNASSCMDVFPLRWDR